PASVLATDYGLRTPDRLHDHLQLHVPDLDDVVGAEGTLLTGVDAGAVDVGAVGAVEVLDGQGVTLEGDQAVLPRAPDAVGRRLVLEVDVRRLLVGAADEVVAREDLVLLLRLLAAQHQQPRRGSRGQVRRRTGGSRGGRGGRQSRGRGGRGCRGLGRGGRGR